MLRNVAAVVAGLIAGMVFNMALVMVNAYLLFPMPPGTDMNDPAQLQPYIDSLPTVAFLVVFVAHVGQAFVGGWVAARLAASRPMALALAVGVASLVGGVMNFMAVSGPTWMYAELPLYLVLAWAAGAIEVRRRGAAA